MFQSLHAFPHQHVDIAMVPVPMTPAIVSINHRCRFCQQQLLFLSNNRCLASSMHSSLVALGSEAGVVRLVESATAGLTVVFRAKLHQGPLTAMAFSPDGKILSVATGDR